MKCARSTQISLRGPCSEIASSARSAASFASQDSRPISREARHCWQQRRGARRGGSHYQSIKTGAARCSMHALAVVSFTLRGLLAAARIFALRREGRIRGGKCWILSAGSKLWMRLWVETARELYLRRLRQHCGRFERKLPRQNPFCRCR
jgi:hypothetical protein